MENDDYKLFLWICMKYPVLTREERVEVMKGILLYLQFQQYFQEWMTA